MTIFGESAGAGSVANHITSPNSYAAVDGPLFHRAAMESGNPYTPWNSQVTTPILKSSCTLSDSLFLRLCLYRKFKYSQNMSYAETRLSHVAINTGCSDTTEIADAATIDCLRALDSDTLFAAKHGVGGIFLDW